jgi:hypothetical protein
VSSTGCTSVHAQSAVQAVQDPWLRGWRHKLYSASSTTAKCLNWQGAGFSKRPTLLSISNIESPFPTDLSSQSAQSACPLSHPCHSPLGRSAATAKCCASSVEITGAFRPSSVLPMYCSIPQQLKYMPLPSIGSDKPGHPCRLQGPHYVDWLLASSWLSHGRDHCT